MKRRINKFFSILLVICMILSMIPPVAVQAATPSTLYFKPNSEWLSDGARFAAYFFGSSGEKWVSMSSAGSGYYKCSAPTSGYASVIIVRMDPNNTTNSWDAKWNQTGDLTLPTDGKNCFIPTSGWWDGDTGSWTVYACHSGGHSYAAATCTAPKTCTRSGCGATDGSSLGHSYKDATCTAPKTCTRCGVTSGSSLGHNYAAATCTVAKKCTRCGTTTGSALGHNYTNYSVTKTPTTSATGTIQGKCSRCSSTNTQTLPKLTTSSYTRTQTKAPTCTATGTYSWKWNTTTYGTFTFTTSIAATGHSYTTKVTAPTCTAQGYTTHTCSKCSNSYKDTYTNALGHNYSYKVTKNPTTSAAGTLVGTCTRCSASTGNIAIGYLGTQWHNYTVVKAATCTAAGTGRYTWKTTTYGTYYWDVSIPATGHSWSASTGKCSTCGTACSHSWNSGSVTTQPTCTAAGVKTFTCNTCKTTKTESVAAKGHSYSGGKCSACGDVRPVQILGNFNSWSGGNMTYSSSGYTLSVKLSAGTYEFKVLKDGTWLGNYGTIYDDTSAAANGWEFVDGYGNCQLAATGGTYNFTFKYDTNMLIVTCNHTHSYTAGEVKAPTCTEKGYTIYTCPCGDSYQSDEKAALGHSWSGGKCSTCGTACSHSYSGTTCTVCGDVREYYLVGLINGADTYESSTYKFSSNKLTLKVTSDSYVAVRADNGDWYNFASYVTSTSGTLSNTSTGANEKMFIPGGTTVVFTLTVNTNETLKLSYSISSCSHLKHGTDGKCTACGTSVSHTWSSGTCSVCGKVCSHSWSGGKCSTCGISCSHSWNSGSVTTAATCTTAGVKTYTCNTCGSTKTESIAATGHSYTAKVTAPTCTAQGYTTHTCSKCSNSYKDTYTAATGHSYSAKVNSNATCSTPGLKTYTCSKCSDSYTEEIPATGHSYKHTVTAATCTEGGYTTHTCSTCGYSYTDTPVAAYGHSYDSGKITTAATCTADGVKTYTCSRCGHSYTESIAATGHSYTSKVTAPTCTKGGYTTYTCSKCSDSYTDDETAAAGHNHVAGKCTVCGDQLDFYLFGFINGGNYACEENGSELGEYKFVDGKLVATFASDSFVAVKTGDNNHWYMFNAYVETKSGTLYSTSAGAYEKMFVPGGAEITFTLTVGEGEVTKTPTCTSEGIRSYTGSICGEGKTESIPMASHSYVAGKCTACGDQLTYYLIGYINGADYEGNDYAFAGGKLVVTFTDATYVAVKAGTYWYMAEAYTEEASVTLYPATETVNEKMYVPAGAEITFTLTTGEGDSLVLSYEITNCPHNYGEGVVTTAPSCTAEGVKTYTCSICGGTKTESVAALGHSYDSGKVTTDPTCTAEGVRTYTCNTCGSTKTESVAALGHSYTAKVTAPTCTADGYTTHTCSKCSDTYTDTPVAATGHSYTGKVTTEATCTAEGVKTFTCSKCGHSYTEAVPATGHSHSSKVTAPTCTEDGYTTYTCACGDSYIADEVAALGHNHVAGKCTTCGDQLDFYLFGFINGKDYACNDDFANLGEYKFVNGKLVVTFAETSYIAVKTGDNQHWYMTQENVTSTSGTFYSTSTGAYEKMTVPGGAELTFTLTVGEGDSLNLSYVISSCPHDYGEGEVTTDPTCTAEGVRTYTCSICGGTKTEVIPATGHSYGEGLLTKAATCTEDGVMTFTCSNCSHSYTEAIPATGHSYDSGVCSTCGHAQTYYLFGFINGANYACEEDRENLGEYKFENGKLVATFASDSYIAVKTGDNLDWYMFPSYTNEKSGTLYKTSYGAMEKMLVPGGVELTFTLEITGNDSLTLSYEITACDHNYQAETTDPTCTADGSTTYTCSVCGHSYTETIPATGHSYVAGKCTACGDQLDYYLIGYINGADYEGDEYKFVDGKLTLTFTDATYVAIKAGSYWYMANAFVEGATSATLYPATETVNEKLMIPVGREITFTLTASEGDSLILSYVAGECEHDWGEGETTKNATCTENGEKTYTCSICGETKTETIPAAGHSYVAGKCTTCGDALDSYLIGFINGSDYEGDDYKFNNGKLVVTLTGDNYVAIKVGGNWYMAEAYTEETSVTLYPATETVNEKLFVPGNREITFTLTAGEGDSLILSYVAGECQHSYENVVTAPTCTAGGYTTHTCAFCGDSYTDSETEPLGHSYVDGTCSICGEKEPVEEKITLYFDISSTYWETVYVYTWDADQNPTDGNWPGTQMNDLGNGIWSCEVSADAVNVIFNNNNGQQTGDQVIPTDGSNLFDYADSTWKVYCSHSYKSEVTAPTCTAGGYTTHTCTLCGHSYTDSGTAALGHSYVDGSCEICGEAEPKAGYNLIGFIEGADSGTGDDWADCDSYWFTDTITVTFTMDAYVAVKKADNSTWYWLSEYSEANPTTFTVNGGSEKMKIPAGSWIITLTAGEDSVTLSYLPVNCEHSYETVVTEPTCTAGGFTTYTCSICGDSYVGDETEALGHSYVDGVCSVCGDGCAHTYEDGICSKCGRICVHSWSGGTCTVCGMVSEGVTIHLVNTLGWSGVTGYFWTANGALSGYDWPGQIINRDEDGYFTVTLDYIPTSGESLNMLFHNFNGGQTADITVSYATLNATRELWIKPSTSADSSGKYPCTVATAESDLVISPEVNGTEVTFRYSGSASSVYLAGSMNGWSSSATAMTKDANGIWSVTLTLDPGVYEYKFIVDGSWITDPCNGVVGGYDGNNIVVVPGSEQAPSGKITVVLHFYRASGDYTGWDVWFWDNNNSGGSSASFTADTQNKGMIATYTLDGSNNNSLGYVVRKSDWSDKEFYDRFIDLSYVKSGTVHFYLNSGSANGSVVYAPNVVCEPNGQYANFDYESGTVWLKTSLPTTGALASQFSIVDANGNATGIRVTAAALNGNGYTLTLSQRLTLIQAKTYKIKFNGCLTSINVNTSDLFYSSTFQSEYNYTGNDLGANWSYGSTTFKVWAPTANGVSVILYQSGNYGTASYSTVAMTPGDKGVWSVTVSGNLHGVYYNYLIDHGSYTVEATDPYAKAAGANGDRGMVVNLDSTDPVGWDDDISPNKGMSYTDAIIYEMHVREFTIDSSSGVKDAWKGKYLGLTQSGTNYNGYATGLEHLKELGVTHVQLMPVYDFKSVDEYYSNSYAWGYDPQNFNVPEGSYSTDPFNGDVRITEFKEMVQTFH